MDTSRHKTFVNVILPIRLEKGFTYLVPDELIDKVKVGVRAEVQFGGKKRYTGIIVEIHNNEPEYEIKNIIDIIDDSPLITDLQYELWKWIADYYSCTIGEVMSAALPSALKLSSETKFVLRSFDEEDLTSLNDKEYLVYKALLNRSELTVDDVQGILQQKSIYKVINSLFRKSILIVKEELQERYRPKIEHYVSFMPVYENKGESLNEALDLAAKSEKQTRAILAYLQLSEGHPLVNRKELIKKAEVDSGVIKALQKKEIFQVESMEVNRFDLKPHQVPEVIMDELTVVQSTAYDQIQTHWEEKEVTLLYGVTGSGKTLIYTRLIQEAIDKGEQVLYLIPEIALSIQIVQRLKRIFGDRVIVSHSRLNNNERVDLWEKVQEGIPVVLGVRSSIFLPFQNLGLIIVDEEHDPSFKQHDPAPRYNARDMAILLGKLVNGKVLLGSATPSIESFYHTTRGKYGLVKLTERYQNIKMPGIEMIDLRRTPGLKDQQLSPRLKEEITQSLDQNEQVIIFKNRRGYAPIMRCNICGWNAMCRNCDISLTYHKWKDNLRCHVCGYQTYLPRKCPACAAPELLLEGYGTEKIEDELSLIFPEARVKRMDLDTTRKRASYEKIIYDFEHQHVDILVGTQMVTKGLDFDHVGLVGVIHADQQLHFPDFRAYERTFQLISQVSGRAGRKFSQGKVLIQSYQPHHAIFEDIARHDYISFYEREIKERLKFKYPPFVRLIKLTIRHKKRDSAQYAAYELAKTLKLKFGERVIGPAEPSVARIRNYYLQDIGIKLENDPPFLSIAKEFIRDRIVRIKKLKGLSTTRVKVDVDPI